MPAHPCDEIRLGHQLPHTELKRGEILKVHQGVCAGFGNGECLCQRFGIQHIGQIGKNRAHCSVIEVDLFERVQQRMEGNKKAPSRTKADEEYLLTTKLFCGDCGRLMVGESGTSGTNGVKYCYYKCGGAKRRLGCKRKPLKKHWIERVAVVTTVQRVLRDEEINRIADAIIDLQNREDTSIPAMRQQLKACEKAIENMLNAIQMGILPPSTKTRLEELEAQRESLKVSILQAELEKPKYTKEQIVSWINRFKYGNVDDIEYQRQIIDTFINAIYVYDDKLVFTYNYKDGSATITPEEIEEAFGSDLTQVAPPRPQQSLRFFLIAMIAGWPRGSRTWPGSE